VWDVFVDASARPTQDHYHLKATIPVYRAVGSLVAVVWLWFANLTVFARARINHIALFDMDTRTSMDRRAVLREASTISVVFFANALFYFKALRRDGFQSIAPNNFPLLLCLYVGCAEPWPVFIAVVCEHKAPPSPASTDAHTTARESHAPVGTFQVFVSALARPCARLCHYAVSP
jgi:hypothetical protein